MIYIFLRIKSWKCVGLLALLCCYIMIIFSGMKWWQNGQLLWGQVQASGTLTHKALWRPLGWWTSFRFQEDRRTAGWAAATTRYHHCITNTIKPANTLYHTSVLTLTHDYNSKTFPGKILKKEFSTGTVQ